MARIIPWKLPDVQGGSVGGYTPAPTPEPLTSYPYDLDSISVSVDFDAVNVTYVGNKYTFIRGMISVSGVDIIDTSNVSSVIATVHVVPGTDTWQDANIANFAIDGERDILVEIGGIMSSVGGTAVVGDKNELDVDFIDRFMGLGNQASYPTLTATTSTIEVTGINVYNSNGVVLQEWEPSEE